MKKNIYLLLITLCALVFNNCNPQCEPINGLQVDLFSPAGYEIKIKAEPLSVLDDKKIYFGNVEATEKRVQEDYLIVRVPNNLTVGKTDLKIEDADCQDVLRVNFTVAGKDTFKNNINFVTPILPDIILPNFTSFTSGIDKGWNSPTETDYQLWFGVTRDTVTANGKAQVIHRIDPKKSFEKSTCCLCVENNKLYSSNPMFGVYDTESNPRKLYFTIDRTAKNAGREEYEAVFITTPTKYKQTEYPITCTSPIPKGPNLKPNGDVMLLVTSKKTGKQTIVFQVFNYL